MKWDVINENILMDSYDTILTTIAGIGGVIIGLFYAGILSLGTSVYAELPAEAKQLLDKEPLGNVFMRFLAFLTFICIILLCLSFYGFEKNIFAISAILFLSGVALSGMTRLGGRLFYLTDPTLLSSASLRILNDLFKEGSVGKFQWYNENFQNHYNTQARMALRTLSVLTDIAQKKDHLSAGPLLDLAKYSLRAIIKYHEIKKKIPGESFWFSVRHKHTSWYNASDTSVEFEIVEPEKIKERLWIERELFKSSLTFIEINLQSKKFDLVSDLIQSMQPVCHCLVLNGEIVFVFEMLDHIEAKLTSYRSKPDINFFNTDDFLGFLSIYDLLGWFKTNAILSYSELLSEFDIEINKNRFKKINWKKEKTLYLQGFPYSSHGRLKEMFDKVKFEYSIYGKRISADWYLMALLYQGYAFSLKESIDYIFDKFSILPTDESGPNYITEKNVLIRCAQLDRCYEHLNKIELLVPKVQKTWSEISAYKKIKGLPWPLLDFDVQTKRIATAKIDLIKEMSVLGTLTNKIKNKSDYRDYSGKFLHLTGKHILLFLLREFPEFNANMFNNFFVNSLSMFDELREKDVNKPAWIIENQLHIAIAPVVDLIALSGYCKLLSEFHNKPEIWATVKTSWDLYINHNKEERLKLCAAICSLPESRLFTIPHRGILRGRWREQIMAYFYSVIPTREHSVRESGAFGYSLELIVEHRSPLVRAFMIEDAALDMEGDNIFIDLYFLDMMGDLGLNFSSQQGTVLRYVEEQEEVGFREITEVEND